MGKFSQLPAVQKTKFARLTKSPAFLILCLLSLMTAGCKEGAGGSSNENSECVKPVTKTYSPLNIDGGHHLYFNPLAFIDLANPAFHADHYILHLTLKPNGAYKGDDREFDLALNGISSSTNDGKPANREPKKVSGDITVDFDLDKLKLNGSTPFFQFILKIFDNRGLLKISLLGKNTHITSASLDIIGHLDQPCPSPSPTLLPTPTPTPAAATTTIDTKTPETSPTNMTSITFTFSADQGGVMFSCSIDQKPYEMCSSPVSYSDLMSGTHNFSVYSTNAFGVVETQPASYAWVVDATAPSVTLDNIDSLPRLTNLSNLNVMFSSSEPGTFNCTLDGVALSSCASPLELTQVPEGPHTLAIYAVDALNNRSEPTSFQWVVDQTAPMTSIVSADPTDQMTAQSSLKLTFVANETSTFECAVDQGSFQECASPLELQNQAEGDHSVLIRATDLAANTGAAASYAWSIDATKPVLQITQSTPAQGRTNSNAIFVEFLASEIVTTYCQVDGAPESECISPIKLENVIEGGHSISIRALDRARNESNIIQLNWVMDFTSPEIRFGEILPSAQSYVNQNSLSFEVITTKPTTLSAQVDGIDLGTFTSPLQLSNLSEGLHEVRVSGVDDVGNPSNIISHNMTIDLTIPVLTLANSVASSPTQQTSANLTFSANEDVHFECNLDGSGFSSCSNPYQASGLAEMEHTFEVRAIDLAGNTSAIASSTWTVDLTPPSTQLAVAAQAGAAITFQLTASETNSHFQCTIDTGAAQSCSTPVNYSNLSVGPHMFVAQAIDAAGNIDPVGAAYNFTVRPPITTQLLSSSVSSLTNQRTASFSFSSNHSDASFQCSLDGAVYQTCTSSATYGSLTDGLHQFKVRAVAADGSIDQTGVSFSWTIDATAPVTSIAGSQNQNAITFTLSSNEPNSTFHCKLDGVAIQPCNPVVSYSNLSIGTHSFFAQATDVAGNVDTLGSTYIFTVKAPITTQILNSSVSSPTNQTSITLQFKSNETNASFICSLDGASFLTCASPKTYSGLSDGNHQFKVKAVSTDGSTDATGATYSWTIDTVAPVPASISAGTTSTTLTISWTTSEGSTDRIKWGVGADTSRVTVESTIYGTTHTIRITGLTANTQYSYQVTGKDLAGNVYLGPVKTVRTNF